MVHEGNRINTGQGVAAGLPEIAPTRTVGGDFYMRQVALEYAVKAGADIDSVIGTASDILKFLKGEHADV